MALGNIPLLWCTASPCCPLCPSAMHHVGLVKWRSENETWREIHPLVYDRGYFASSNYLSLRTPYFSPMFLCIYLNIIANTVQNFQTEILHVGLCCRLDDNGRFHVTTLCLVKYMNNKAKVGWTVVIFTYWSKNILSATKKAYRIKTKRDVKKVFVRIQPEKYDPHPLDLQPLQP